MGWLISFFPLIHLKTSVDTIKTLGIKGKMGKVVTMKIINSKDSLWTHIKDLCLNILGKLWQLIISLDWRCSLAVKPFF